MANRYTYETNAGHGTRAARICVALSDVELGRLQAYVRRMRAQVPAATQSGVIRDAVAAYIASPADGCPHEHGTRGGVCEDCGEEL
jgi:hypothetical protein